MVSLPDWLPRGANTAGGLATETHRRLPSQAYVSEIPSSFEPLTAALADRYRIDRVLGKGGMATVLLAQDVKHDRQVALKVLEPEVAAAVGAKRFLREIQVTANLQHPHILPLYDSGEAGGMLYYVMPLVRGESLQDRLRRDGPLTIEEAVGIARQVAAALDFAHRHGVVHRDIKPANILLQDDEALLSDFGIAVAVGEAAGERITETGLSIGTPAYMSPEQATGERELDARSDIYSLGAVTYEMLAGEPPVSGASARVVMAKLMTERPTPLHLMRDAVPSWVEAAVMRAMAKVPIDRFATAREFADALTTPTGGQEAAARSGQRPARTRRPATIGLSVAAVVAIAAVAGYAVLGRRASAPGASDAPTEIRSIAVLPLDNYSGDPSQDYFAEGMTDELTTTLATLSQLRVISRGSAMQFQGRNRPATPEIAKELGVDAVVEGSVVRSGEKVRINAQLIDARADSLLWAQSFERSSGDVLALQADLASAIAGEINVRLSPSEESRLAAAPSVDPQAHDAYLRGRFFFNRPSDENLRKAIEQFKIAVSLDSTFAPAYSGLSDAYLWAGYNEGFITASAAKPKAREAAEKAVALDSMSAEAHTSLAVFKLFYEWDWAGCEREFRRAIALNPSYAFAPDQFTLALAFTGRDEEAAAQGRRAAELDPLSPQVLVDAAMVPIFQKDVAAADELMKKASALDPTFFFPVMTQGWARLGVGRFDEAIPFLVKARTLGAPPFVTAFLSYAYGAAGDRAKAMAALDTLTEESPGGVVAPFNLALVYLGLGEHARAIDELEKARAADSQSLGWLGRDAIFDPLRSDPRFVALLKDMHFVD
ncbi:MAG: protein kinase [Gemmatimonadetes bacterium]|nr:protein kinase [Gemmatimonadota bacterium]